MHSRQRRAGSLDEEKRERILKKRLGLKGDFDAIFRLPWMPAPLTNWWKMESLEEIILREPGAETWAENYNDTMDVLQEYCANVLVVGTLLLGFIMTGTIMNLDFSGSERRNTHDITNFLKYSGYSAAFAAIGICLTYFVNTRAVQAGISSTKLGLYRFMQGYLWLAFGEMSIYISLILFVLSVDWYLTMTYRGADICVGGPTTTRSNRHTVNGWQGFASAHLPGPRRDFSIEALSSTALGLFQDYTWWGPGEFRKNSYCGRLGTELEAIAKKQCGKKQRLRGEWSKGMRQYGALKKNDGDKLESQPQISAEGGDNYSVSTPLSWSNRFLNGSDSDLGTVALCSYFDFYHEIVSSKQAFFRDDVGSGWPMSGEMPYWFLYDSTFVPMGWMHEVIQAANGLHWFVKQPRLTYMSAVHMQLRKDLTESLCEKPVAEEMKNALCADPQTDDDFEMCNQGLAAYQAAEECSGAQLEKVQFCSTVCSDDMHMTRKVNRLLATFDVTMWMFLLWTVLNRLQGIWYGTLRLWKNKRDLCDFKGSQSTRAHIIENLLLIDAYQRKDNPDDKTT